MLTAATSAYAFRTSAVRYRSCAPDTREELRRQGLSSPYRRSMMSQYLRGCDLWKRIAHGVSTLRDDPAATRLFPACDEAKVTPPAG